jgi:hypothetical protein
MAQRDRQIVHPFSHAVGGVGGRLNLGDQKASPEAVNGARRDEMALSGPDRNGGQ